MHRIHGINMPGKATNGWIFDPISEREEFLRKITLPQTSRWNHGSLIETTDKPLQVCCTHAQLMEHGNFDRRPGLVSPEKLDSYYWQCT
jgi:hypothetical protein|tara:strand:+ start:437 stop:703 length:267 start_codon:yes stop_codon:yes gene_type:complete